MFENIKSEMTHPKLLRITTVPLSLKVLLKGQHRFMTQNGLQVIGISSPGPELDEVHHDEGIPVIALEMTRTISPLKDLKALWQFYRLCKKEQPAMVHSHTPKAGIVGMLGARLAGVPIRLHTVAGLPLMETRGAKRTILEAVEKLTYACATRVYPNSRGLYDFILRHQLTTPKKLKVIAGGSSNGIDTTFFAPEQVTAEHRAALREHLGIAKDDFVFIFVGRLVGDKGINELVKAFCQLTSLPSEGRGASVNKTPKLLLVGPLETELDPLLPETLKRISQHPGIISVGFQKDVRPYFAISACLAFPSYREGFPNVVMQAGAMDLPSVVTDINGCNEIISEGENGKIIPVKNAAALHKAMEEMLRDEEGFLKMNENARRMITSRYEQSVVWSALLEEYQKIIS